MCGDQRKTGFRFSPFTLWVLGIELRFAGLARAFMPSFPPWFWFYFWGGLLTVVYADLKLTIYPRLDLNLKQFSSKGFHDSGSTGKSLFSKHGPFCYCHSKGVWLAWWLSAHSWSIPVVTFEETSCFRVLLFIVYLETKVIITKAKTEAAIDENGNFI